MAKSTPHTTYKHRALPFLVEWVTSTFESGVLGTELLQFTGFAMNGQVFLPYFCNY